MSTTNHQQIQLKHCKLQQQQQSNENPSEIVPNQQQHIPPKHSQYYRPDIDGLRTIAVSIVVIFHAWPKFMTGGFIGVDIFFVISGYLISSIILREIQKNKFSFVNFYIRRIKRIFPALLFLLTIVFISGCFVLMHVDIKILAQTIFSSTIFSTNFRFLIFQKDYFDPDVTKNPLLHLWSLAIQQQFYFIWPLFLLIIVYAFKKNTFRILLIFTLASFIYNCVAVYKIASYAFYFPLCRFWEMSIGGLIAYRKIKISNINISNSISIVAITAILINVWIIDENSLFPGFWALVPTLSAALIILAGSQSIVNKYILSSRLFVFVGKISYPLYLWHWPLLVFSRLLFSQGSTSIFSSPFLMVILSVLFSIFTYYCIEKPLRFTKFKWIVLILILIMLILLVLSYNVYKQPKQYSYVQKRIQQIIKNQKDYDQYNQFQQFQSNQISSEDKIIKKHILTKIKQKQLAKSIYQKSIVPGQKDFYFKNGKWLVNSSKNKYRKSPTLIKILLLMQWEPYKQSKFKRINSTSKYFDARFNIYSGFQILNQGQDNVILIVGDSHCQMIAHRFDQLYKQSIYQKRQKDFPTVIVLGHPAKIFIPCNLFYDITLQFIKKHKPNKVFIVQHWIYYLTYYYRDGPLQSNSSMKNRCNFNSFQVRSQTLKDIQSYVQMVVNTAKQMKSQGIDVYVSAINAQGKQFEPYSMIDFFLVIKQNIQPVKLSQFREQNKQIISLLENSLKKADIKIIDFSDNQCWDNICEVFTPSGYPIFSDTNHYSTQYGRYWVSSVDFLTEF